MDNVNEILKSEAINLGLCRKWQREWNIDSTQQELIDKYKRGIDFCIEKNYPSNEFIKRNFSADMLAENLIFIDEHLDMQHAPSGIYILNGSCHGTITFDEWSAATLFVRHETNVKVVVPPFSKVFVRVYDNAEVETICSEDSFCRVLDRR